MDDYANMKVNRFMPKKVIMNKFYDLQAEYNELLEEIEDLEERLSEANYIRGTTSNKLGDARSQIEQLEDSIFHLKDFQKVLQGQVKSLRTTINYKNKHLAECSEELKKIKRENSKSSGKRSFTI